jgi:hypothetical protein
LTGFGRGACCSCPLPLSLLSRPAHFRQNSCWRAFVFFAWLRLSSMESPAGCASDGASLLVLELWRLRGCQPAYCSALDTPHKSSPRHGLKLACPHVVPTSSEVALASNLFDVAAQPKHRETMIIDHLLSFLSLVPSTFSLISPPFGPSTPNRQPGAGWSPLGR